jgi:hypothetical protein
MIHGGVAREKRNERDLRDVVSPVPTSRAFPASLALLALLA